MVAAAGTFVANDTCMKLALAELPPLEVLAIRGFTACLWCLPLVLVLGQGASLARVANGWPVARALCEFVAIVSFIFALRQMPIADLTAIVQTTPLIVVIGAALLWGEHVGVTRALLIGLGIVGALLVAQPGTSVASPYAIFGFGTAIGAAGRDLLSRKVDPAIPGLIVALTTLATVMIGTLALSLLFEAPVMPGPRALLLLTLAGFLVMCGHLFIFLAFRFAPPRVVAPFNYSFTIWAVLSGYFVFSDIPNAPALAGMALIVASGLAVILLEGRTRRSDQLAMAADGNVTSK